MLGMGWADYCVVILPFAIFIMTRLQKNITSVMDTIYITFSTKRTNGTGYKKM